jgi:hypothetical protein
MAKQDFCFTYYDGDAARDKAHMSRLERGAYDDIISAQRKRGHLSLEDIQKVLSKDFEVCWPSLEWVLLKDEEGKYFIEWVEKSISKMATQSKKQRENVTKRWEKDTKSIPSYNNGIDVVMPLVNGNGDVIELEEKGVTGEKTEQLPAKAWNSLPTSSTEIEVPAAYVKSAIEQAKITKGQTIDEEKVLGMFSVFKVQNLTGVKWYQDERAVLSHFLNWLKSQNFNNGTKNYRANSYTGNVQGNGGY